MKRAKVTHVVFDVGGTLLDTESIYTEVTNAALAPYGKKLDSALQLKLTASRSLAEVCASIAAELCLPCSVAELLSRMSEIEVERWPNVRALPGAKELVEHLASCGIPMAIATGGSAEMLALKTRRHRSWFRHFGDAIVTASDPNVLRGKPHPDMFLRAAQLIGKVDRFKEVLAVENAVTGVAAAVAAGMTVLAVPDPVLIPGNEATFSRADLVLSSLADFDPAVFGLPPYPHPH